VANLYGVEGIRLIEDYRDDHLGAEIWALGLGWSLDDYPNNFFDDKITIALDAAFLAFPNCTYFFSAHSDPVDFVIEKDPEVLKKFILCLLPSYQGYDELWPTKYGNVPIWIRVTRAGHMTVPEIIASCRNEVVGIIEKRSKIYTPCWSSINIAIIAAIVLGAKKVTMVGCSTLPAKDHSHALRAGISKKFYPQELGHISSQEALEGKIPIQRIWRKGTCLVAELFKPYGIEIRKYYYKTGYEEIEPLSNFNDLVVWPP